MFSKSIFIVIEGLDGSGKTTAGNLLAERLERLAPGKVLRTNEPNDGCCAGQFIRDALKHRIPDLSERVLRLAYAANRLDHCDRLVSPWLDGEAGRLVVCDRGYLSSLVYQSGPDFDFSEVMKINEFARRPEVIFFITVSDSVCYERLHKRGEPFELFDRNVAETREKYWQALRFLRSTRGENIVEIDGNGTPEEVTEAMLAVLKTSFFKS